MTNKKLKEKIASLEKELAELKNELKTQDKIWKPKEDEKYWTILDSGGAWVTYNNATYDKEAISYGNYFKTKEEAEKQAEYNQVMNRFRKYVEAYSEPLDWENDKQTKYHIKYEFQFYDISYVYTLTNRDAFQIYASSPQVLKDAIIYSAGSEEEFIRIVFGGKK